MEEPMQVLQTGSLRRRGFRLRWSRHIDGIWWTVERRRDDGIHATNWSAGCSSVQIRQVWCVAGGARGRGLGLGLRLIVHGSAPALLRRRVGLSFESDAAFGGVGGLAFGLMEERRTRGMLDFWTYGDEKYCRDV